MTWRARIRLEVGDLDLDVDLVGGEEPVALIGPNGAGKTTLLRTFAGALRPSAGVISVGDEALFDAARGIDVPIEQRRVGYVPQGYGLFPHLDVLDNVAFGRSAQIRRGGRRAGRRVAAEILERMGCAALADRRPATLSGGEQQRVALARALAIAPRMLLLDEPLAALDAASRRHLRSFLSAQVAKRAGRTLVVTHDHRDVAALGARVVVLEAGRIVQQGSFDEVSARPATEFVEEFFPRSLTSG